MLQDWITAANEQKESWKFTSLKPMAAHDFRPVPAQPVSIDRLPSVIADAADRRRIVFVDGHLQRQLSLLAGLPAQMISGDAFGGYDLTLDRETCLAIAPLELLFIATTHDYPVTSNIDLRINVGASGRLTLITHHLSLGIGAPHAVTVHKTIKLGAHAKLVHATIQEHDAAHYCLTRIDASLDQAAFYDHFALTAGAALARHEIKVKLCESEAQVQLNGLMLLRGQQHTDTTTLIEHLAPNTSSREVYKSVVLDKGRAVFQGKIHVAQVAQKTDGHQLSKALLLSDSAEINTKPELEIYADDVKCSHGATVGQLDETALFYLRSRGIDDMTARTILVKGFLDELIDGIGVVVVRDHLHHRVDRWLQQEIA
jgi:Fe-S cluster assembly protein SufD